MSTSTRSMAGGPSIQGLGWAFFPGMILAIFAAGACDRPAPNRASGSASGETATSEATVAAGSAAASVAGESAPAGTAETNEASPSPSGSELYVQHCAGCHGVRGDGKGIAATFLFPKPRDLRAGRFRLVSTTNNVPTREDLQNVLLRGMPGSSMPPWKHLSAAAREALVDEVLRIRREGAREIYVNLLKEEEGYTDEDLAEEDIQQEIEDHVAQVTTPGETTEVPEIGEPTEEGIAAAKQTYAKFGCLQCHGPDGKGNGVANMVDQENFPTSPRDFTAGIFKGGHDPASLYRRIAFGMPGTPMPSSAQMTPAEMMDLVHYIRSMSTEEQREAAVLNREQILVRRLSAIVEDPAAPSWDDIPAVSLRMVPLWWRQGADALLQVRAMHDGQTIAVRLSWSDATMDGRATRGESFEDGAAMALYRGNAEPFLGMGDPRVPVDVWFWDADRQVLADIEDEYPRMVVDIYPFHEAIATTAEYQRQGTRRDEQPQVSMPAVAAGNAIAPSRVTSAASSLTAGGPGSVTFRTPQNQHVTARGHWQNGRWSVVMQRPLVLTDDDKIVSLSAGETVSASFAVWDGAMRDRNGQKMVTIWQDFTLAE